MKTKFLFLFVLLSATAFSQDEPTSGFTTHWYYGFGITGNQGYNISNNLRDAGVKRIPDVLPAALVGWNVTFSNRLSIDAEIGVAGLFTNKKSSGSQLMQVPVRARLHYIAVEKERFSLAAGANFTVVGNDLSIWSDDTEVDMDNLDPEANTGYLRLRNTQYFAGPSATVKLIDGGETFLTLTLGYDFSLAATKWKSDYAKLNGTVKENSSQFFANLSIPF